MIVFITTPGLRNTVASVVDRTLDVDLPNAAATTYPAIFGAETTFDAVHVFTDFERLSDADLARAATLYRRLRSVGITCLNDPARVMTRYQLLTALQAAGINPFGVYRADGLPRPRQFPVFVRAESDHDGPISDLIHDQEELERYLRSVREGGRPLRGLIVTEFAGEPVTPGWWRRYATFRIGAGEYVHGASAASTWAVKKMDEEAPPEHFEAERLAVVENQPPDVVLRALDVAGVEWGRADYARYRGGHVIYEINTSPVIQLSRKKTTAMRDAAYRAAAEHVARLLWGIDAGSGATVAFEPVGPLKKRRRRWYQRLLPRRRR